MAKAFAEEEYELYLPIQDRPVGKGFACIDRECLFLYTGIS